MLCSKHSGYEQLLGKNFLNYITVYIASAFRLNSSLCFRSLSEGRGQPFVRYSGNISFRGLCYKKQAEYFSMHRNAQKDNIARSIVHEIKRRGGRFLRRHGSKGSKGSK